MRKKTPAKKLPAEYCLIETLPEIEPILVAEKAMPKIVIGTTAKTWSNWFHAGIGPRPFILHGRRYYKYDEILKHFKSGGPK